MATLLVNAASLGDRRRTNTALAALAAAAFVYVTAETFPVALLPQLSSGLGVSGGSIGLLVTVYAGVAGLTALPLTAWSSHIPRRRLLVGAVGVLTLSQVGIALAPDYATVMALRVPCALAHGVFWSVIAPVAASLEAPGRAGRATAIVFTGNSLALVLGTPITTALGAAVGWRAAAAVLAVAAALATIAVLVALPSLAADSEGSVGDRLAAIPAALRNRSLLALCFVTALVVLGHYSVYTFITRLVQHGAGVTGLAVSAVLFAYGAAGIAGNGIAGVVTDRWPRRTIATVVATVVVALVVVGALGRGSTAWTIVALLAWGAGFTALPVCLQAGVLRVAPRQPDTGSALYVVAFQIGIGGGAFAGSVLVDSGGLAILPFVGAALVAVGLIVVFAARRAFPARTPDLPRPAARCLPDGAASRRP